MGRIVVSTALSVDGCAEGAGGDLSVMPLDAAFDAHDAGLVAGAAGLLYGARTYRQMVGYWPHQLEADDPAERTIARRMADGLPVTVVSDGLTADETDPWRAQTTVVPRAGAHAAVGRLRRGDGDTVVFGGQTLWTDLRMLDVDRPEATETVVLRYAVGG